MAFALPSLAVTSLTCRTRRRFFFIVPSTKPHVRWRQLELAIRSRTEFFSRRSTTQQSERVTRAWQTSQVAWRDVVVNIGSTTLPPHKLARTCVWMANSNIQTCESQRQSFCRLFTTCLERRYKALHCATLSIATTCHIRTWNTNEIPPLLVSLAQYTGVHHGSTDYVNCTLSHKMGQLGYASRRIRNMISEFCYPPPVSFIIVRFTGRGFESLLGVVALGNLLTHACLCYTKQYNLVPAKGVISLAWKVTVSLVESNGSLPPGLWLMPPVGWLPRSRDQLRA